MRVALADGFIDTDRHQVERQGHGPEALSAQEAGLVDYLVGAQGRPVSRDELLITVWKYSPRAVTRAVDKAVNRLRRKIEADHGHPVHLLTVRGEGYRFVPAPTERPSGLVEAILTAIDDDPTWVLHNRGIARAALEAAPLEAKVRIGLELCDAFTLRPADVGLDTLLDEVRGPSWDALFVRQHLGPILAHGAQELSAIAKRATQGSTVSLAARRRAGLANAEGQDDEALAWLQTADEVAERSASLHVHLSGRFPLVAKLADVDPERARQVLADTQALASDRRHWPSAALASALLGSVALDQGAFTEAETTLGRVLPALERVGNERVLYYMAARHGLARLLLDQATGLRVWLARAEAAQSRYGQAFLWHAIGCDEAMHGPLAAAEEAWAAGMALKVPFASEAIALDRAFENVRRGTPWSVDATSAQGRQAFGALRDLALRGCHSATLTDRWPRIPHGMLWRWRHVLEGAHRAY